MLMHSPGVNRLAVADILQHTGLYFYQLAFTLALCEIEDWPQSTVLLPVELKGAVKKRQVEYLLGRYCAREALLAAGAEQWLVARGSDRAPVWPEGFIGSISHRHGQVIACVAEQQSYDAVGIDMEKTVSPNTLKALYSMVINPEEIPFLADAAHSEVEWATLIFSAKESLFKALYPSVGRYFDFRAADVVTSAPQHLTLRLTTTLSEEWPAGSLIPVIYHYQDEIATTLVLIPKAPRL